MTYIPTLYTPRLVLRPFVEADASRQQLAGDKRVSEVTANIPHPYPDGEAERWIGMQQLEAQMSGRFTFAVTLAGTRTPGRERDPGETGHVIGCIYLTPEVRADRAAVIGYWIGVPYWNRGFATEACGAVLRFGFDRRRLHRITGRHFLENSASGRVMQKLGMLREGVFRQSLQKDGEWRDVVLHAVLAEEWEMQMQRPLKSARMPAVAVCV